MPSSQDLAAVSSLGPKVVRVEWDIRTDPTTMDGTFTAYADRGAKILMLAGFDGFIPTTGQAQNLGNWVNRFGPGGTFWASYGGTDRPVTHIEFGNETSYAPGQFTGVPFGSAGHIQRAKDYAQRFKEAQQAITLTGKAVGLLCQVDDGGSSNPLWVNNMYAQVPNLHTFVNGWTVHPYGPTYMDKTTRCCVTYVNNASGGAAPALPIDITECGVSTDNGTDTGDNYGWSTTMTYASAATTMAGVVQALRNNATIGPRLRHFMVYQIHDQQPGGIANHREYYFGALKNDGTTAKGAYTPAVQTILAAT